MVLRWKRIRQYRKVFAYLLLISVIAFAISRGNAHQKQALLVERRLHGPLKSTTITQDENLRSHTTKVINEKVLKLASVPRSTNAHEEDETPSRNISKPMGKLTAVENVTKNELKPPFVNIHNVNTFSSRAPEVRHIGFLKVHKAASSTMQNIFFRFGYKRNLTFVFTQSQNYFSRSVKNHLPLATPRYSQGYDILCNHGIFNYSIYSSVLPRDTVYIGIVRDPLSVFVSAVNFYSQRSQALPYLARIRVNKLKKLIYRPDVFDKGFFSYTKNVMARDFGFPESNDLSKISMKLNELDKIFRLVLIVEQFEESLVLMKRYLNWKMQDILFIPNNVYVNDQNRAASVADLTQKDVKMFKIRNSLDYHAYEYFLSKFRKQFQSEPDDIGMEVLQFKRVLTNVSTFCHTEILNVDRSVIIEASEWNEEFTITVTDCQFMMVDELSFISFLRHKQARGISQGIYRQGQNRFGFGQGRMRKIGSQQSRHVRLQRMMEDGNMRRS